MEKELLNSAELKSNAKLRKLIKEFMDSEEDVPEKVLNHIKAMQGKTRILAPVDISEENLKKFNSSDDEEFSFDVDIKLIEDEDHNTWIPLFTSEQDAAAANEEDEDEEDKYNTLLPFFIEDVLGQVKDSEDIDGAVIDPWTNGFPLPKDIIEEVFKDENDYYENEEGTVSINLVHGEIQNMDTECIVNSANNMLSPGAGGVDKDIHDAAGEGLAAECRTLHGCRTGEAKITDAYDLKCNYVIHTVGPMYSNKSDDEADLAECYDSCLYMAREHGLHSITFPCISTGYFGYPKKDACDIAVQTVLEWLTDNDDYEMEVTFCCKDDENYNIYQEYLDEELGDEDEE